MSANDERAAQPDTCVCCGAYKPYCYCWASGSTNADGSMMTNSCSPELHGRQAPQADRPHLLDDNRRLRAENETLRAELGVARRAIDQINLGPVARLRVELGSAVRRAEQAEAELAQVIELSDYCDGLAEDLAQAITINLLAVRRAETAEAGWDQMAQAIHECRFYVNGWRERAIEATLAAHREAVAKRPTGGQQ